MGVASLLYSMINATVYPAVQAVTPNRLRGQAVALVVLSANLLRLGLAPTVMALASDYVLRDEMKLQQAVGGVSASIAVSSLLAAVVLPRAYRRTHVALTHG